MKLILVHFAGTARANLFSFNGGKQWILLARCATMIAAGQAGERNFLAGQDAQAVAPLLFLIRIIRADPGFVNTIDKPGFCPLMYKLTLFLLVLAKQRVSGLCGLPKFLAQL